MKNVKIKFFKFAPIIIIVIFFGWGMSISATDDIKSATSNFSVLGVISEISEEGISINEAKGSDKSGKDSYELNIEHLDSMQTNEYVPLNFIDIKVGDKIIAQGLTNGNTFFIKRIISFTSKPTPVENVAEDMAISSSTVSTSTDATSTSTDENSISSSSDMSTSTSIDNNFLIDVNLENSTTTDLVSASTSTSTENSITETSIVENLTNTVEEILNNITDTIDTVVEAIIENDVTDAVDFIPENVENI